MGKQTFDRIKKTLCIFMAVLFVASLTAASVSAGGWDDDWDDCGGWDDCDDWDGWDGGWGGCGGWDDWGGCGFGFDDFFWDDWW